MRMPVVCGTPEPDAATWAVLDLAVRVARPVCDSLAVTVLSSDAQQQCVAAADLGALLTHDATADDEESWRRPRLRLCHAPVFARCVRLRCSLFDVVVPPRGVEEATEVSHGSDEDLVATVSAALTTALSAHTGTGAVDAHGTEEWRTRASQPCVLQDTARTVVWLMGRFLPLTHVPALALGVALSAAADVDDVRGETETMVEWHYVCRSPCTAVPLDTLQSHWAMTLITRAAHQLPASGSRDTAGAAQDRLAHYARTAAHFVSAGGTTRVRQRLSALLAVLADAHAHTHASSHRVADPLPALLSRETRAPQRLLCQWFTFLSADAGTLSAEVTTDVHAVVFSSHWMAELEGCDVLCSVESWLRCIAQWLTWRVLEAALELLPTTLRWGRRQRRSGAVETCVRFRSDAGAVPERTRRGLAAVSPSRWMEFRSAVRDAALPPSLCSIAAALPELHRSEAVLVCVLERLMRIVVAAAATGGSGSADDGPRHGQQQQRQQQRVTHSSAAAALALLDDPATHSVVVCRLHLGAGAVAASPRSVHQRWRPPPLSSHTAHAPVVAALVSWYAIDFAHAIGRLHRLWGLVTRRGRCGSCYGGVVDAVVGGCIATDVRGRAAQHAPPGPGLLGRCLLMGMWMRMNVVDVDDGASVAVDGPSAPQCGTLYYSGRRHVLHVREWGTLAHLHRVAACLSLTTAEAAVGVLPEDGGDGRRRREECCAVVRETVAGVVQSFARALVSAAVVAERRAWRTCARIEVVEQVASASSPAPTHAGAGDDADDDDDCVLVHWSCAAAEVAEAAAESSADVELLCVVTPSNSTVVDVSVETLMETSSVAAAEVSALGPALLLSVAAPLLALETRARAYLVRCAVSELLWLACLAECHGRRAVEESETARRQHLSDAASVQRATAQRQRHSGGGRHADSAELHEDECLSMSTTVTAAAVTRSCERACPLDDEAAARRGICGAETCQRCHLSGCQAHLAAAAVGLLRRDEACCRAHLHDVWALSQEEWQCRWRAVLVPECILRDLLRDKAVAAADLARSAAAARAATHQQQEPCIAALPVVRSPTASTPMVADALAHRTFLLSGDEDNADGVAVQHRDAGRSKRAAAAPRGPVALFPAALSPRSQSAPPRRFGRGAGPAATAAAAPLTPLRVPVVALSLCEAPSPSPARRVALGELSSNHLRPESTVRRAGSAQPRHPGQTSAAAVSFGLLGGAGGGLAHHTSQRRAAASAQRCTRGGGGAARGQRPTAERASAAAIAEAVRIATTAAAAAADHGSDPTGRGRGRRVCLSSPASRLAPPSLPAAALPPPRRLRKPVVTWSADVQEY